MGIRNKNFLFKTLKKQQFITKNKIIKLNFSFLKTRNCSFILAKKNSSFFYKIEKLYLFIMEVFIYFLNFFDSKNKSLFLCDEKVVFYLGKTAFLRSFQSLFFGFYNGGFFMNDSSQKKEYQIFFKTINIFFLFSTKNHVLISKEINFFYKPLILFLEKNISENFLFYRVFSEKGLFYSYFIFFKLLSDFLIKIQIYNYISYKAAFH